MTGRGDDDGDAARTPRRRTAVVLLLVVGTVLIPAALVGSWVRSTVFDTSGYVDTVGPLADDPTVQSAVADTVTTALLDEAGLSPRTATVLRPLLHTSVEKVVAADAFAEVWRTANRVAHDQVRLFLTDKSRFLRTTGGTVGIPVGELLGPVRTAIYDDLPGGVRQLVDRPSGKTDAELVLIDSPALARAQTVIAVVNRAGLVLPVAVALTLSAAIVVSPRRRSTVRTVGWATAAAGAVVVIGVVLVRAIVVARAADDQRDLLGPICDALTGPLLHSAGFVCVSGLLVALAAVAGPRLRRTS